MVDLVIGSGPAGIATAHGLLARGRRVTLVDPGATLEPRRAAARDALAARGPEAWSTADRDGWQAPQFATPDGQVRRYGSDFAMEPAEATFAATGGLALRASHAVGGLSNLWGAAVLPYADEDMAGWPISAADLAPHYAAVTAFLPVAGGRDRLEALFPALSMAGRTPLPPGPQADRLLGHWRRARTEGRADDAVTLGLARQAVAPGCRLCGQCLHGCPWGLIWSAAQELPRLRASAGFTWAPGAPVRSIEEDGAGVTLRRADGTELRGERVFLAAGVLESARILLASGRGGAVLTLRDSPHGFLPLLETDLPRRGRRRPDRGPVQTLAKLFLELRDAAVSPYLVHSQLYGWNEFYAREMAATHGRRLPGSGPIWRALARRLIVAQVFLHSDHGARAELSLTPDGRLNATLREAPDLPARFATATARLASALRPAKLRALRPAARLAAPGASFHAGATLPMAQTPGAGQSDPLGRPHGSQRLHLTDASCLPAIPATTITLPVMANAHRIATLVP